MSGDTANYHKIQINRAGEPVLEFYIRRLSTGECYSLWEKSTERWTMKKKRAKRAKPNPLFRSLVIYAATVDEDKAKTWDNAELHETHGTSNPVDIINRMLPGDAKDRVYMRICAHSGFEDKSVDELVTQTQAALSGNGGGISE